MNTQPKYLTLTDWAQAMLGSHKPHINTLRNWVNQGRIHPAPVKIGKSWYVTPNAKYHAD